MTKRRPSPSVSVSEPPQLAARDWRLHAATATTEAWTSPNTGITHPPGTAVIRVGFLQVAEQTVAFTLPNPAAMYLSLSSTARNEAAPRRASVVGALRTRKHFAHLTPRDEDDTPLFDCLERLAASVVFGNLAIEAFANERLPAEFQYQRERPDKRCTEVYSREQAERWLTLEEKLTRILPRIHGVASPKGAKVWEDFRWLNDLRNRCVHLKEGDWNGREPVRAAQSVWSALLEERTLRAPEVAAAVVRHFYPEDAPRWVQHLGLRAKSSRSAP